MLPDAADEMIESVLLQSALGVLESVLPDQAATDTA